MIFYKDERAIAGLVEKMQANSSVAYITPLEVWQPSNEGVDHAITWAKHMVGDSKASVSDDDLFYTKSILVSTNWNKNDDVFDRVEVWGARHTPSHKPTNIEHDEKRLVGHITDVWAIDAEGKILPDNLPVDDLPDLYHLVNGAVVYTSWQDEKLVERTEALISDIESGKKFVSMEALFSNFSYAIITPDDDFRVLARSEETAFLTKHLRAYGGNGEFEGCKLGRLLKNITFSGKGYVDNPANENSVILNNKHTFDFSKASSKNPFKQESGVSYSYANNTNDNNLNQESQNMAENIDFYRQQNERLEKVVSSLQAKYDELQAKANAEGMKKLEDRVTSLETELAEAKKSMDDEKKKKEEAEKAKSDLQDQLNNVTKAKDEAEVQVAKIEAQKIQTDRIATLVDGGVSKEDAIVKVELFAELSAEQFEAIASELIAAVKVQSNNTETEDTSENTDASEEEDITTDEAEANADESVVDDAEADETEVNLSTEASSDSDETEDTRKELSLALSHFLSETGNSYANDESADNDE